MAMSIQTCIPSSCKNQHSMKTLNQSPNFLRRTSSMRQNTANRKSAVERLEESKANYVKSECVLDTKQEFKNSCHLRVSTGPQLDLLFKAPSKNSLDRSPTTIPPDPNLMFKSFPHSYPIPIPKSPQPVRARAKSQSEFRENQVTRKLSFASRSNRQRIGVLDDVESQLKRLISSNSKENITNSSEDKLLVSARVTEALKYYKTQTEIPKVRRGYSDPIKKSSWFPPENCHEINYSIHKSMPDLSPSQQDISSCVILSPDDSEDSIFPPMPPVSSNHHLVRESKALVVSPVAINDECNEHYHVCHQELRRFSNGTGTLHLTPYFNPSDPCERRPVSRSKSDVSHRHFKRNSEHFPRRNNYTSVEIERFFDTMGLDTTVWHHINAPSVISSPPCFFESISSIDSNEERSSVCSEDSNPCLPREGLRNHDLRVHGPLETSIVEKNARVIKWLYNCRKAVRES